MPIVDGEQIIARQLQVVAPTEVVFDDEHRTLLTPARSVPALEGKNWRVSLDGRWRVLRWPFRRTEDFLAGRRVEDRDWAEVVQPGKVFYADPEAEGGEIPGWNRVTQDHIPDGDGAMLRRWVKLPGRWKGRRVFLRFDAIYPAGRVYVNGVRLGEHFSGLTPAEYDVTDHVRPGRKNLVAVRLLRKHRFLKMDMVRHGCEFAGLAQSACFHATEPVQVADLHLVAAVDARGRMGTVEGAVVVANRGRRTAAATVKARITDADGRPVAEVRSKVTVAPGASLPVPVKLAVRKPLLWNDEYPNLYRVRITLAAGEQDKQTVAFRTGFRRLELLPAGPRLNGRPVKFRGVNHLTFHPEHGMHTPEDWLRRNLLTMKKANVNAIRTHFLGPRCLADLCDELGIYLLQELPIDWGTNYIHDPAWVGPALQRIEGGIRRDRHHPSVMVWSVGNENMPETAAVAEDGWNHLRIYDRFAKTLDPSRPTMFPPPGPANKISGILEVRVGDIADIHYSFNLVRDFNATGRVTNPVAWDATMETLTREEALARGWSGVWFSSEYGIINTIPDLLNAPYNSIIADRAEEPTSGRNSLQVFADRLREEWGLMRGDPTCLGGAFFPWICAGAGRGPEGNPWGWVRWAEDADWGVLAADLTPKPQFWALRVLFSPVWFPERLGWEPGQTELVFDVENQFNAIDLKECVLRTQMAGGGKWLGMMRKFRDIPVSCPPGAKTTLRIPLWNRQTIEALAAGQPVACRVHLLDPRGFRVLTHDILVAPREKTGAEGDMPIGPDAVL